MKTCSFCQTIDTTDSSVCPKCGQRLPEPGAASSATIQWTGPISLSKSTAADALARVETLFRAKSKLLVGRGTDCDICLPHPSVSRYHALLEQRENHLWIGDLGSVNGVWVGHQRIREPVAIAEGETVGIGPFLFTLREGVIHSLDSSRSLLLEARQLEKVVPIGGGQRLKLLDQINLCILPGEFVTLLGPSGSGKSTLMDCLNGRRRATGGQVLANGADFYRHFDNFRQSLGYVPQKDIVHTGLTVYRALYYTARLRLPTDTAAGELENRIAAVIRVMELEPHQRTLVANLSGGQIKRVSLGAELLAQPCLLFIDEATSGLDAGTEARMMRLFRNLADEGRSIICITHNVDNVEQCHLILVLARGKMLYYGPPSEATTYFGVGRISEIYDRLGSRNLDEWEQQFHSSSLYKEYVEKRLHLAPPAETTPLPRPQLGSGSNAAIALLQEPAATSSSQVLAPMRGLADRIRSATTAALRTRLWVRPFRLAWHQFCVLTSRYLQLIFGDRRGLRLLLLQAPIVALFLLVGFYDKDFQSKVPVPRRLSDGEKKMLDLLDNTGELLRNNREVPPEEIQALKNVKVDLPLGDKVTQLSGLQLLQLFRHLYQLPTDTEREKQLRAARLTFSDKPGDNTLSVGEVLDVFHQLRDSNLVGRLKNFKGPLIPEGEIVNPRYTYMLVFITVVVVLWFGCNNAAKEIVKEEAIYSRERSVNLGIFPYLGSKFLVMSLITILHSFLLMAVLFGSMQLLHLVWPLQFSVPSLEYMLSYPAQFGILCLLSMTGVALGLMLSACVATPDRANALLPYVLIPQLILGGGFLSVGQGMLYYLAVVLSPVYWAYRAVHLGASTLPEIIPGKVNYADSVWLPAVALGIQCLIFLLLTAWFLKRKDSY